MDRGFLGRGWEGWKKDFRGGWFGFIDRRNEDAVS